MTHSWPIAWKTTVLDSTWAVSSKGTNSPVFKALGDSKAWDLVDNYIVFMDVNGGSKPTGL